MKFQVKKPYYNFEKYFNKDRWMSYWYQISLISKLKQKSVLEVGAGANFLKKYFSDDKMTYKTLDIAKDLNPDILGGVDNIPLKENSFDLVCAFQVLEHLPFEKFEQCLKEMQRVSKKDVLISLPYSHRYYYVKIKIPFAEPFYFGLLIPRFLLKYKFSGEHYWEIGTRGYSLNRIKKVMSKYFKVKQIIHPNENKYHVFFVLEKK